MKTINPTLIARLLFIAAFTSTGCSGLYTSDMKWADTGAEAPAFDEEDEGDDGADDTDGGSDDGSSSGGTSWPADDGSDSSGGSSSGTTGGACTYDDFPVMIHQATQNNSDPTKPWFFYQARDSDTSSFTELQIMSYQADPYYGPTGPGSYDLSGLNYADCALCMLVVQSCDESYNCAKGFFIESGTLEIDQMSSYGGTFGAALVNASFVEVTINPDTYESTPVVGGERWCVDRLNIDVSTYLQN